MHDGGLCRWRGACVVRSSWRPPLGQVVQLCDEVLRVACRQPHAVLFLRARAQRGRDAGQGRRRLLAQLLGERTGIVTQRFGRGCAERDGHHGIGR